MVGNEDLLVLMVGFKAAGNIGKTSEVVTARCSPHHTALIIMVIIVGYKEDIVGISCNLPKLLQWIDVMYESEPDPFPEIEYLKATFKPGHYVIYSYLNSNDGRKYTCSVTGVSDDGWVRDVQAGTCFSQSFRLKDVMIWEHGKRKRA